MKKYFKLLALAMAALVVFASCETDEVSTSDGNLWEGELAAAKYASDAVLYNINADGVQSVELTGSGLYFVTPSYSGGYYYTPTLLRKKKGSRAFGSDEVLSGRFTKSGSATYVLVRLGTMTVGSDELSVSLVDGTTVTWPYEKAPQIEMNALNTRICRTWKIKSAKVEFLDSDKKVVGSNTFTPVQVAEEFISFFTFSRAGRIYQNDEGDWYAGSWDWYNAKSQIVLMRMDDENDGSGVFQVMFSGDEMTIVIPEAYDDNEDLRDEYSDFGFHVPASAVFAKEYLTCTNYTE